MSTWLDKRPLQRKSYGEIRIDTNCFRFKALYQLPHSPVHPPAVSTWQQKPKMVLFKYILLILVVVLSFIEKRGSKCIWAGSTGNAASAPVPNLWMSLASLGTLGIWFRGLGWGVGKGVLVKVHACRCEVREDRKQLISCSQYDW